MKKLPIFILLTFPIMLHTMQQETSQDVFTIYSHDLSDQSTIDNLDFIYDGLTCIGSNQSPHIAWKNAPEGTKSFAIVMYDLDSPLLYDVGWMHWIAYNIPADISELPRGANSTNDQITSLNGIEQSPNSYGQIGYGGPCPPEGNQPHTYQFTVYALSDKLPEDMLKDIPTWEIVSYFINTLKIDESTLTVYYGR